MKRSTRDATRILRHTKSYAPKVFRRIPFPSEGSEGDIALGNTPSGIKLFAKLGNKWYSFSADKQALDVVKDNIEIPTANTFTVTNLTTDRTYNANSTTVAELADILGTLIRDLKELGFLKSTIT